MADGTKITQMPAAGPISEDDLFPIVQGGVTKRATRAQVIAGLQAALGFAPEDQTNRNARNGYVGLIDGKIDPSFFPAFAGLSERFPVDNEPEMLALDAEPGDIAIRSDEEAVFLLARLPATDRANWVQLEQPAIGVTDIDSAAGTRKTGSVRLNAGDLYDLSRVIRELLAAQSPGEVRNLLVLGSAALEARASFAPAAHAHPAASRAGSGFMSAADKVRLDALTVQGQATPTGAVLRFPKSLKAVPTGFMALTDAIQKFDPGTHPVLEEVLGLTNEPGAPGGFVERQRLQASDAAPNDWFGQSLHVSADGKTMVVGAFFDDNSGGQDAGSVYVYGHSGSTWTQQARLQASDAAPNDRFGEFVRASDDGKTIFVGSPFDDDNAGTDAGSVYVYRLNNSVWSQSQKIRGGYAGAKFGSSLAVTPDASTLVVGVPGRNGQGESFGSVEVFTLNPSNNTFGLISRLQAPDGAADDDFGRSVAVSSDASVIVIGSPLDDNSGGQNAGSVYTFNKSGSGWAYQSRIQAPDATAGSRFGSPVVLSPSGQVLGVGAVLSGTVASNSGSVYIFEKSGPNWVNPSTIKESPPTTNSQFGQFLIFIDDESFLAGTSQVGSGKVALYEENTSGEWVQQAIILSSDGASGDQFGHDASFSPAGTGVLAVSSRLDNNSGGARAGSVYVFERTEGTPGAEKLQVPAAPDANWTWAIKN